MTNNNLHRLHNSYQMYATGKSAMCNRGQMASDIRLDGYHHWLTPTTKQVPENKSTTSSSSQGQEENDFKGEHK